MDNLYRIYNKETGLYLSVDASESIKDGFKAVVQHKKQDNLLQFWKLIAPSSDDEVFYITSCKQNSAKKDIVLDIMNKKVENDTIIIYTKKSVGTLSNQQWKFKYSSDGYFYIATKLNGFSDYVLSVDTENSNNLKCSKKSNSDSQKWRIEYI